MKLWQLLRDNWLCAKQSHKTPHTGPLLRKKHWGSVHNSCYTEHNAVSYLKRLSPMLSSCLCWRSSWREDRVELESERLNTHPGQIRGTGRPSYLSCVFQPFVQVRILAPVVNQQIGASDNVGWAFPAWNISLRQEIQSEWSSAAVREDEETLMKHLISVVCMFKVDHNKTCTKGLKSRLQIWVSTSAPFKVHHTRFALFMKFKLK